jgi:arylsulfatase A-like enzyme
MPWATWSRRGAVLLALLAIGCAEPPPSILLVTLDTLRRDHVGAFRPDDPQSASLTPHLDALAAEGLVHDSAWTTMPTTGPAHLSLFTGLLPSQHTAIQNGRALPARLHERELGLRLARRGYATAAFVATRLLSARVTGLRGFEFYDGPRGKLRHGNDVADAALAWLRVERRRPVFLWAHFYDPHSPYGTPNEKRLAFPVKQADYGFVDTQRYADPETRARMADRYARGVVSMDAALGRLVAGAREILERPPLVAVVADHGEHLAEHLTERGYAYDHGEFLDREGVAIPLVLAGPGVAPGRSPAPASIRDLYTTLLAAAGIEDAQASQEGRRDLRVPSDAPRVVRIERRHFRSRVPQMVGAHAAAATDGVALAIVGEDGRATQGGDHPVLLEAARSLVQPASAAGPLRVDPETRRALRELGYAE